MSWVITGTQKTSWNPTMMQAALWLDASDATTLTTSSGVVDQWSDKSGNSRHATGTSTARPALTANGLDSKSVVTFDGTNDALFITPSFLMQPNVLIACVVKENNGGFGGVISSQSSESFPNALTLNINSSRTYEADYGGRSVPATTSTGANWGVLAATYTPSYTNIVFNGTVEATVTGSTTLASDNPSPAQVIGKYRISDSNFGAMDLAELVISTTGGETFERQRLEGYLAHKWGLTANLPSNHPYKVTPPSP